MNLIRGDGVTESHWIRLGCSTTRAAGFPLQVKVPVCVPCSSARTMPHPWPRYRIWRVLVFCTNLCQKSFSNFYFSILRVYIFLILCEVMNNTGDRNTGILFLAALKIFIFELDPDQPISTLLPAEAILDFTNSLSPLDINHQVNVAAEVSLHWTSAKKKIDTMVNWGFSLKFTCTLRL